MHKLNQTFKINPLYTEIRIMKDLLNYKNYFTNVEQIPGNCSAITLTGISIKLLRTLKKEDIEKLLSNYIIATSFNSNYEGTVKFKLSKVKTVIIFLNSSCFWHLGTPWKKGYSYKGNSITKCYMFYINFK